MADPHVIIDDIAPRREYVVGATPTAIFAIPFAFFSALDILVYVGTALLPGSQYSVVGQAGADSGFNSGSLILNAAVANTTVQVVRDVIIERTTDFLPNAALPIRSLNTQFDKNTAWSQETEHHSIYRTLSLVSYDPDFVRRLPDKGSRAGAYLHFDSFGEPEPVIPLEPGDFIQGCIGAVPRPYLSKVREVLSVTDFGADRTGVVRSDAAFQLAQNCATALGGATIFVPSGTYIIGGGIGVAGTTIIVGSNTHWIAAPGSVILLNRAENLLGQRRCFEIADVENVSIDGFIVDGAQQVRIAIAGIGVVRNINILNMEFRDHVNFSIAYGDSRFDPDIARYEGWRVENCRFTRFSGGLGTGAGINLFPKAFDQILQAPSSFGFLARKNEFDLRFTPGEFLAANKNTKPWAAQIYAVGARVAADTTRLYFCIVTDGAPAVTAPTGTGAIIVTGDGYKWGYAGELGTLLGAFAIEPPEWLPLTLYSVIGDRVVTASHRIYGLITPGTSAASGGPGETPGTETDADIPDGTAHWEYLGVRRNLTTTVPYAGGAGYGAGSECRIITHKNLATEAKAQLITTIVGGVITEVIVDPLNPGEGITGDLPVFFFDPTFSGRDASFGDPTSCLDHGIQAIKISNADNPVIEDTQVIGGNIFPINITNGVHHGVVSGLRVRQASGAMGVTGGFSIVQRRWVDCSTDVNVAANTLQMRLSPGDPVISHGLVDGDVVALRETTDVDFPTIDFPAPLVGEEPYFVVGATATTVQLSVTLGGAAIDITDAGLGFFLLGRTTGLKAINFKASDVNYTRDGIRNADSTAVRLAGRLDGVSLTSITHERSLAFKPFRATDGFSRVTIDDYTIVDGNLTIDPKTNATFVTHGIIGMRVGVLNLRGAVTGTGRVALTDPQVPCFRCSFDEINLDGFTTNGVAIGGVGNRIELVTARGGNQLGNVEAPIVRNFGRDNSFGPIHSLVPEKGIAAWIASTPYAENALYYSFAGSPVQKRFYRVTKAGTSGVVAPISTDNNVLDGTAVVTFLWANSSTHFFSDKDGLGTLSLTGFVGECIDIADGVAGKGTRLVLLENFNGDVSAGFTVPATPISARQGQIDALTLSNALSQDFFIFDATHEHVVLGWSWLVSVATSADPGIELRCGLIDQNGVVNATRFGSMTSLPDKAAGYMHAVAIPVGNNRLLPARSELIIGHAGMKVGAGAVFMRAWLVPLL